MRINNHLLDKKTLITETEGLPPKKNVGQIKKKKPDPDISRESFQLNLPHFDKQNLEVEMDSFCSKLKFGKKVFIQSDFPNKKIKQIFSGEPIALGDKIPWHGSLVDLHFLVDLMHDAYPIVLNIYPDHWKVAANCFCDKDGNSYKQEQLKTNNDPPSKKSADLLTAYVKALLPPSL